MENIRYHDRSKSTAAIFAFFLGGFGAHKFYLGRTAAGFLYLFFCWTLIPSVIGVIESILLFNMTLPVFDEKYNFHP